MYIIVFYCISVYLDFNLFEVHSTLHLLFLDTYYSIWLYTFKECKNLELNIYPVKHQDLFDYIHLYISGTVRRVSVSVTSRSTNWTAPSATWTRPHWLPSVRVYSNGPRNPSGSVLIPPKTTFSPSTNMSPCVQICKLSTPHSQYLDI